VVGIFRTGIMVMVDKEYLLPYARHPWFEDAPVRDVFNVRFRGGKLGWPDLDVDLEIDFLGQPERAS
jgi:hypothetical protein